MDLNAKADITNRNIVRDEPDVEGKYEIDLKWPTMGDELQVNSA